MPTATPEEVAEYRRRVRACQRPVANADSDREWRIFLAGAYRSSGELGVFRELSSREFSAGMDHVFRFIRGEIDGPTLVAVTRRDVSDAYIANLRAAGLIGDDPADWEDIALELHLEMLKAYLPLSGMDPAAPATCEQVTRRGAVVWCRFVDALHSRVGLPTAVELSGTFLSFSGLQSDVMASGRFDAFAMADEAERGRYLALLRGQASEERGPER